jgi:hypothetical protein
VQGQQREGDAVTDRDKVRLLFGPYRPPVLKRGDRATCLYRDCLVYVTGWSDALIPWPLCRRLEPRVGKPGLLVDEELARAVRHESATAVMHWWGVSSTTLMKWRRALGMARMDNPGTARLVTAALENACEVWEAHQWTEEEREQRRRRAAEQGFGELPPTHGYQGPRRWKADELALLGAMPDAEVARRTGRTAKAVLVARKRLGIGTFRDRRRRANREQAPPGVDAAVPC